MKKSAEHIVKDLIRKMREVCNKVGDCPIKKARLPTQEDCIVCLFEDHQVLADKAALSRASEDQRTTYGTSITKLEVVLRPELLPELAKQIGRASNGQR